MNALSPRSTVHGYCSVCGYDGIVKVDGTMPFHRVRRVRQHAQSPLIMVTYASLEPEDRRCAGGNLPPTPLEFYRPADDEPDDTPVKKALTLTGLTERTRARREQIKRELEELISGVRDGEQYGHERMAS